MVARILAVKIQGSPKERLSADRVNKKTIAKLVLSF